MDSAKGSRDRERPAHGEPRPPRAADRIRETARRLFYREGIRAVGVDEIVTTAGVTKPSLYRSFASKDELAACYLSDFDAEFWAQFDAAVAAHPGDPRAQIRAYFERIGTRSTRPGYRGCALTNAAVEYPQPDHPARLVAEANKRELRRRFREIAAAMGTADPDMLGDSLMLLFEGALVSAQLFGPDGPGHCLADAADRLIGASPKREL